MLLLVIIYFCSHAYSYSQIINEKYELWEKDSYLRGFNVINRYNEKRIEDFMEMKSMNCSFSLISVSDIFRVDPPYSLNDTALDRCDSLVKFSRSVEMYYALAVRAGPGRRDVWEESKGGAKKSTIWQNLEERKLYASMLRFIVERYEDDSLFIGIAPFVEPNPLLGELYFNDLMVDSLLKLKKIDLHEINNLMIDSVRKVDKDIPVIVQNVVYSSPEFFSLMEPYDDPYIVYEVHCYRPSEYVHEYDKNVHSYPGTYFSVAERNFARYDKKYLKEIVFENVRNFERKVDAPFFLGEFTMTTPQRGGVQYLEDMSEIAMEFGWSFALWVYISDRHEYIDYNFRQWGDDYWQTVKNMFTKEIEPDREHSDKTLTVRHNVMTDDCIIIINFENQGSLRIYNTFGEKVDDLTYCLNKNRGYQELTYNTEHLSAGSYFAVLSTKKKICSKILVVTD